MPDENFDDDYDSNDPDFMRKLRQDAKAGKAAAAELAKAKEQLAQQQSAARELAFYKAGIDTSSGVGALFSKAYDGEFDVDAIKGEWEKLGVSSGSNFPQVGPVHTGIPTDQQQAMSRISEAATGGVPTTGAAVDFNGELDAIPLIVDGNWNPNYVQDVLTKTAAQAAREGRTFEVSQGDVNFQKGAAGPRPATTPL